MTIQFGDAFKDEKHQSIHINGNDVDLLLIHGFPGTPYEMRPIADIGKNLGWTVRAPLLPGFGQEIDTLPEKTADDWYGAVKSAYHDLSQQNNTIIVIGLSMGGALAIRLASEKKVDALILLAPFWTLDHILWQGLPLIRRVIPRFKPFRLFKPDFTDPNFRRNVLDFLPSADLDDPQTQQAISEFEIPVNMLNEVRLIGEKAGQVIDKVTCSTMVIQGTKDELVTTERTKKLISKMSITPKTFFVDGEHELTVTENAVWGDIEAEIRVFLEQWQSKKEAITD